jgi:hypothetical protein
MPPIEVFVGLDAIRDSSEVVPGLPTPSELRQWIIEHDAIEKETEIFDTGELKKLRKFTRGSYPCIFALPLFFESSTPLQLPRNEIYPRRILTSLN